MNPELMLPWLGIALPATLQASAPRGEPIRLPFQITALSESGAAVQGMAALPLNATATGSSRVSWARDEPIALHALQRWLYGRAEAWPPGPAPPEWQALGVLLASRFRPGRTLQPERLSLVPQQLAPDRCGPGNHSDRSPAAAS